MPEKFDTIIVGGGIGGTALGALLAAGGQNLLLTEKNSIIGGRCASYRKDGFTIDVGVHLFGLSDKGPLGEVCRRAGEPDAIEWVLARNPRVAVHRGGRTQPFDREAMMRELEEKSVAPLAEIFARIGQMTTAELDSLWYLPLKSWIEGFTPDRNIMRMFTMLCGIYLCVPPDSASTAEFIICLRDLLQARNSGYPKGGSGIIPQTYQRFIEKYGGTVRLNCPTERIVIENERAKGIVAGGELIEADRVVSNADIKCTVLELAGDEHFPREYVEKVRSLTYAAHVFALKVAIDEVITDQKMIMYTPNLTDEELEEIERQIFAGQAPPVASGMICVPTNFDPGLAPPGKQLVFFGIGTAPHQEWATWEKICLDALKDVFPTIEEHIIWKVTHSPDDIERFAGEKGNVIGVGQTVDQIHEKRPTHETPVKDLYLCSAEAGGHGIGTELAASSAIELADKLLSS
ncbi:MAG: NAD(P)/FAD-dependent oxidoreductase [Deltaproteobacteria bacterium]|nr:MAG: NAD(P)/FAD-dependent oxidoreductase [Deltaproteobacteria bacterium]